jgi:hypothetical protein
MTNLASTGPAPVGADPNLPDLNLQNGIHKLSLPADAARWYSCQP